MLLRAVSLPLLLLVLVLSLVTKLVTMLLFLWVLSMVVLLLLPPVIMMMVMVMMPLVLRGSWHSVAAWRRFAAQSDRVTFTKRTSKNLWSRLDLGTDALKTATAGNRRCSRRMLWRGCRAWRGLRHSLMSVNVVVRLKDSRACSRLDRPAHFTPQRRWYRPLLFSSLSPKRSRGVSFELVTFLRSY